MRITFSLPEIKDYPPVVISMFLTQMARSLCNESAIGVTDGHQELRAFVERYLSQFRTTD